MVQVSISRTGGPGGIVLKNDGQFIGYRSKPAPGAPVDPLNNFKVERE